MKEHKMHADRFTDGLQSVIRLAVRILAVLMTVVIVLGVVDVAWQLHQKAMEHPRFILTISDMLGMFGAFMAVLIAIEIFVNITIYLREDVIHVKIVMATALMAIARKIIILDLDKFEPPHLWGLASIVLAMSIGYWLVVVGPGRNPQDRQGDHDEGDCPITKSEE
jgi:uncharacterized membrane protein (DUF373 family)